MRREITGRSGTTSLVVVLLGLVVAVLVTNGAAPPAGSTELSVVDPPGVSAFERAREPGDRVPAEAEYAVGQQGDVAGARLLSEAEHTRFYAFPARDGRFCLLGVVSVQNRMRDERMWSHAVTCSHSEAFAKRGAYISLGADDRQYGVLALPDGAGVELEVGPVGAIRALEVRNNHLAFGPFSLEATDAGSAPIGRLTVVQGRERIELQLPAAALQTLDSRS